MPYVYIIKSVLDGSHYRGFTELSPEKRLQYHNQGNVMSTKNNRPWTLVWYAKFETKQRAIAFEKYLKSGSGYAFSKKRLI